MKKILNEWREYSEHHDLFENHEYIKNVLGIKPLLNESGGLYYSSEIRKLIIEEQLLFEGFFSDLKDATFEKAKAAGKAVTAFGKGVYNIGATLKQIFNDPTKIKEWVFSVHKTSMKTKFNSVYKVLNIMIDKLPSLNMPTFAQWAQNTKNFILGIQRKIVQGDGWKGALFATSASLALNFLWNEVGEKINDALKALGILATPEGIKDKMAEVKEIINEKVVTPIKEYMVEKLKSILGEVVYSTFAGWMSWATKAFKGVKFVVDTLGTAMSRQNFKLGVNPPGGS